jgi:hypothetical protein
MSTNAVFRDAMVTLTGTSDIALPLNGSRQFLAVQNIGTSDVWVNLTGVAAAVGGAGSVLLKAAGTAIGTNALVFDKIVPQSQISVIGTAAQKVAVLWA